ncbi:MAG: tetratricopeptide repeat protein, partial [Proteobacteria bacterium]|nr:tetratricopeptide repeat protein [Pseudomonadota bacterium]
MHAFLTFERFTRLILRLLAVVSIGAALGACATVSETAELPPVEAELTSAEPPPEPQEIEYGSFTEEQLYQAIISELGAKRGEVEAAGENYFDLAFDTRDLGIVKRAMQFASINNDLNALLQLGLLWAEISPQDPQPHLMLSFQFLENGTFDQALSHMARVIDLGGSIDFSTLAARTGRLNPAARVGLIDNLRQLVREFPAQESIHIALIQMLGQNREAEAGLDELDLLKNRIELTPAIVLLEAQLQQNLDRPDAALRTLRSGVRRFETDKSLRLTYARLLIQNDEFAGARKQFEILVEQDPEDWETYYSVALLDMEMDDDDSAIRRFTRLIEVDQRVDESQYYLGLIYEQREQLAQAIEHYRAAIEHDPEFGRAYSGWAVAARNLGLLDDAATAWEQAMANLGTMTERERLRTQGIYYWGVSRNFQKAIETYETLVEKYPADAVGRNNLAVQYFLALDFESALREGRLALEIYPGNPVTRSNYALYAMYSSDFDTAVAEAEKVRELDPTYFKAWLPIAINALANGDFDTARDAYRSMSETGSRGASTAS